MSKGFKEINMHGCISGKLEIPNIGENGNWFIGNEDTGVSIQGPKGDKGDIGPVGPQVYRVTKAIPVFKGLKVTRATSALKGPKVTRAILAHRGL